MRQTNLVRTEIFLILYHLLNSTCLSWIFFLPFYVTFSCLYYFFFLWIRGFRAHFLGIWFVIVNTDVGMILCSLKDGTLNMEMLQFKTKFPREVLLCRVCYYSILLLNAYTRSFLLGKSEAILHRVSRHGEETLKLSKP